MTDKSETFSNLSALLREALGAALSSDGNSLPELMTDDVVFEFPFPLPDGPRRLIGKAAFEAYLPKVGALLEFESLTLRRSFVSADNRNAVVEFSCKGRAKTGGQRYDQDYVSVIGLRAGRICSYRDYWNPLIVMAALNAEDRANLKE
jgi:ketosteroid isomerase-like protein